MDGTQHVISDADLATAFEKHGAASCRMAADKVMGNGAIQRLRDIPYEKRSEFLGVLHLSANADSSDLPVIARQEPSAENKTDGQSEIEERADPTPVKPDLDQARRHIQLLTGHHNTRVNVRLFHDGKDKSKYATKLNGAIEELWPEIEARQAEGYGAFVVVNEGGNTDASITRTRALFIDGDDVPLPEQDKWHAAPDFLVIRDSAHWHAYWRVTDLPVEQFKQAQRRLAAYYGTDPTVSNRSRVMRLAGTLHLKDPAHPVLVALSGIDDWEGVPSGRGAADLLAGLPEVAVPEVEHIANEPARPKGSDRGGVTPVQLHEMLSYIDPTFDSSKPANFNTDEFGGDFEWGMSEWAGLARMIWNGEIPLVGEGAENFDWHGFTFAWSSGELWSERTGEVIVTSCPESMEALGARLSGETNSTHYTVGTIIKLARACGYNGKVGLSKEIDFEIGSDIELARRFLADLAREGGREVIHAEGEFYQFDGTHWAVLTKSDLRPRVHQYDGMRYGEQHRMIRLTQARVSSILHEAAVMVERPGFFDAAAIGINCCNGFIRFDQNGTPTLTPHDPGYRARHVMAATWRPDMDWSWEAPLLSELLNGCFRDDADKGQRIDLLSEICGAVAMGLSPQMLKQPKAFVLFGKHANNGKNQILDMIRGLVPPEAVVSVNPSQFDHDAYRVKLRGRLLNTASELGTARTIASEAFKYIVTGDPMTVNVKYRDPVEFRARAIHMFATNVLPPFQGGMDRGVRRRLIVLNFTRVFEPHEMIEGIGVRVASEQADALLAFAVAGASRLLRQGGYTEPPSSAATVRDWVLTADPVLAWVDSRTDYANGHAARQHDLYTDFTLWAQREGFDTKHLPAINNFVARVLANDGRLSTHRTGHGGRDGRVLRGLKLRTEGDGTFEREADYVLPN